jgi:hypothetical protein
LAIIYITYCYFRVKCWRLLEVIIPETRSSLEVLPGTEEVTGVDYFAIGWWGILSFPGGEDVFVSKWYDVEIAPNMIGLPELPLLVTLARYFEQSSADSR